MPVAYEWRVISDDVDGKPLRFELVCGAPITIRVWLSRGNSENVFTRSMEFPAGQTVLNIPNNVANRVRLFMVNADGEDPATADYRVEVGA